MQWRTRLTTWTDSYPRMLWLLAFGSFLNSTGLSFIWPLTTVYIHDALGRSMTVAGTVLLLHSGGAMLGQLAGGWLYDRIGARPVMLGGLAASAIFTAVLGLQQSWPVYVVGMVFYGFAASLPIPPVNAMVSRAWPGQGRRAFNFNYVANNLGVAVGTAMGGVLADRSFALAFFGASALFLLFGLFTALFIREEKFTALEAESSPLPQRSVEPDRPVPWVPIVSLFVAYVCLSLVYTQWQLANSVQMPAVGYALSDYSVLWTLNGLLIFAGQPLLSWIVRLVRKPIAQMALGVVLYAAAFGLLLTSTQYSVFVASMVLLTFGEMLLWPIFPATVARLSPPSKRGSLQGFILTGATVGRMIGPLVGGMLNDAFGYATQIAVMASSLVLPLLAILFFARVQPTTASADGD